MPRSGHSLSVGFGASALEEPQCPGHSPSRSLKTNTLCLNKDISKSPRLGHERLQQTPSPVAFGSCRLPGITVTVPRNTGGRGTRAAWRWRLWNVEAAAARQALSGAILPLFLCSGTPFVNMRVKKGTALLAEGRSGVGASTQAGLGRSAASRSERGLLLRNPGRPLLCSQPHSAFVGSAATGIPRPRNQLQPRRALGLKHKPVIFALGMKRRGQIQQKGRSGVFGEGSWYRGVRSAPRSCQGSLRGRGQ